MIAMRTRTTQHNGFTLIELLVVIAIIAILAAILFPVFAKVREKARQTSCASNMKQLGLGILQYVEDYDEKFPAGFQQGAAGTGAGQVYPNIGYNWNNGQTSWQWAQQVYTYEKSMGIYKCPDEAQQVTQSYDFNLNLAGETLATLSSPTLTVACAEFGRPALGSTVGVDAWDPSTFADASVSGTGAAYTDYNSNTVVAANGEGGHFNGTNPPRHGTGVNYLASDGHVKFLNPTTVSIGNTPNTSGCIQYYAVGTCSNSFVSASSTDTMKLQDGVSPATLTYSTL